MAKKNIVGLKRKVPVTKKIEDNVVKTTEVKTENVNKPLTMEEKYLVIQQNESSEHVEQKTTIEEKLKQIRQQKKEQNKNKKKTFTKTVPVEFKGVKKEPVENKFEKKKPFKKEDYKRKNKFETKKRRPIVNNKEEWENDIKRDIGFKIRKTKNFDKAFFEILHQDTIRILRKRIQIVLGKYGINFENVHKYTLEFLKVYHYLLNIEKKGIEQKFVPNDKDIQLIICMLLLKDAFILLNKETTGDTHWVAFKNLIFDNFKYKKSFVEFFQELYETYVNANLIKDEINEMTLVNQKINLPIKYYLLETMLNIDELFVDALDNIIEIELKGDKVSNQNDHDYLIIMISMLKKIVQRRLSDRTNLEWYLIPNRLKIIRNRVSNSESIAFNKVLEKAIRDVDLYKYYATPFFFEKIQKRIQKNETIKDILFVSNMKKGQERIQKNSNYGLHSDVPVTRHLNTGMRGSGYSYFEGKETLNSYELNHISKESVSNKKVIHETENPNKEELDYTEANVKMTFAELIIDKVMTQK